jgi:hypothetical protein
MIKENSNEQNQSRRSRTANADRKRSARLKNVRRLGCWSINVRRRHSNCRQSKRSTKRGKENTSGRRILSVNKKLLQLKS